MQPNWTPPDPQEAGKWQRERKIFTEGRWVLADLLIFGNRVQSVREIRPLDQQEQAEAEQQYALAQDPLQRSTSPNAIAAKPRSTDPAELLRRQREEPDFLLNPAERKIVGVAIAKVQRWGR